MADGDDYVVSVWRNATGSFPWKCTVTLPNGLVYAPSDLGAGGGYDLWATKGGATRAGKRAVRLHRKHGMPKKSDVITRRYRA